MSERFRYRKLTAVRDEEAVAVMKAELQAEAVRFREYAAAGARAEDEAPKAVLADEREGTRAEIEQQLRSGELMPSDLVFSGGSWTTFDSSPDFFEACEGLTDTRALAANTKVILKAVVGVILAAALIAVRLMLRH